MKKLSQIIKEKRSEQTLGYVSSDDLKKYLEVAKKIISSEAKTVIAYVLSNPNTTDEEILGLAKKRGVDPELSAAVKKLQKYNRFKELPQFQTPEEFEAIMNQECTVDELLYDFASEAGRNEIVKHYDALVHKIAKQYVGKSNLDYDELVAAAYNGFTEALNKYAKGDRVGTDASGNKKWVSFGTFAAQQIRFYILEDIKNLSHTVRIPTSAQQRERDETNRNTKNYTVSGDEKWGSDSDGNAKTRFDMMGSEMTTGLSGKEVDELWDQLIDRVREVFGKKRARDIDVFMDSYGLRRDEAMKDKDVAKKYGIAASNVTRIKKDIINFIKNDKYCRDLYTELGSYYNESVTELRMAGRVVEGQSGKYRVVTSLKEALLHRIFTR